VALPTAALLAREVYARRDKRTAMRDLAVSGLVVVLASWLTSLLTLAQNGMLEAASLTFGLLVGTGGVWLRQCGKLMIRSMAGIRVAGMAGGDFYVDVSTGLFALVGYGQAVPFAATSNDAVARNITVCVAYFACVVALSVAVVLVRRYLAILVTILQDTNESLQKNKSTTTLKDAITKLRRFRRHFTVLAVQTVVVALMIPVVFIVLGSFPFVWLIWGVDFAIFVAAIGRTTLGLLHDPAAAAAAASPSASNSNHSRVRDAPASPAKHAKPKAAEAASPGSPDMSSAASPSPLMEAHVQRKAPASGAVAPEPLRERAGAEQ